MAGQVRKLSPFGAEITGVDLRHPVERDDFQQLHAAFIEHGVLVFRSQELSKQQLVAFTRNFGPLQRHVIADYRDDDFDEVMLVGQREERGRTIYSDLGARFWHSDGSASQKGVSATALYAVHLPGSGGNTELADQHAAYDALSPEMKERIEGLKAVHDLKYSFENTGRHLTEEQRNARRLTEGEVRESPPVEQPVVGIHPQTGRKALYVGFAHTSHIVGMPVEEGRKLVWDLVELATQRQFVYSHAWAKGDLLIWDNRRTLHRGTPYPAGNLRVLWRTTSYGEGVR